MTHTIEGTTPASAVVGEAIASRGLMRLEQGAGAVSRPVDNASAPMYPVHDAEPAALAAENAKAAFLMRPEQEFKALLEFGQMLVASGFLPSALNTAAKAVAVILTGREMGISPMLALRSINIVDGKPIVAADLQLSRFKANGGRAHWQRLDDTVAELWLRHPNGDEHTERFTIDDAKRAELLSKKNWQKYPAAMLRSRVISAGLKSIGYEPTSGVYDVDEADDIAQGAAERAVEDARARGVQPPTSTRTSTPADSAETPSADESTSRDPDAVVFPMAPHKGLPLDIKWGTDAPSDALSTDYRITDGELIRAQKIARAKLVIPAGQSGALPDDKRASYERMCDAIDAELERRGIEEEASDAG